MLIEKLFIYGFLTGLGLCLLVWLLIKLFKKKKDEEVLSFLAPLKERIDGYQKLLDEQRERSVKQSEVLKNSIQHMMLSNRKVEEETHNMFMALKGDNKYQGDWGEVVLERTFEICGLEKNRDYILQGEGQQLYNDDGKLLKPDALVMLPDEKTIVVDSKVSLSSLVDEDMDKLQKSLLAHIDNLSSKKYQNIDKFVIPDFVVMFIPVESCISLIYRHCPQVFDYALKKNIVIASPLSLLPILKTVSSLWRLDSQNKNSFEIARQAGLLYDRFISFRDDMAKMKKSIDKLNTDFGNLDKRLAEGKGNLTDRAAKLKELGAKTSK